MSLIENESLLDFLNDVMGQASVKDLFERFAHPEVTGYLLAELQRILAVGVDLGVITQSDETHYTLPALINASDNRSKAAAYNEHERNNLYLVKPSNLDKNLNNRNYHDEAKCSESLTFKSYISDAIINRVNAEITNEDKRNEDIKANSKSNPSCPPPSVSPSPSRSPSPSQLSSSAPSTSRKQIQRRRPAGGTNRNRRTISRRKRNSAPSRSRTQRRRR
ncbi:uncharacterized protein ACN2A1_014495 isoform 1-T1 [Glossina fuscipes fuscipes]